MDPYLYQYGLGGIVFFIGLLYGWKQGYLSFQGRGLRNLIVVFAGLAFFAGLQGYLQYGNMTEAKPCSYPCAEQQEGRSEAQLNRVTETAAMIEAKSKRKALDKSLAKGSLSKEDYDSQIAELPTGTKMGTNLDYGIMIVYFLAMLGIGTWFGRGQSSTKDFFFGGQRFSWWLIGFSLVATTIGSYSFVKYSKVAYTYGLSSSQTYMNDWFWIPLLIFGWLPILYFSRVVSIPEYFERRFGKTARKICTALLLAYLVGYVGVNLFTMGKALNILLGWPIFAAAAGVASISAVYVTFGGQTSVIMTDLFQGFMLLATGLVLLYLGIDYLGGLDSFWENLPRDHRKAFPGFADDPRSGTVKPSAFPAVGIFWQDAMANSAMFYFLNQGMVMRLMAARTINDSRKAMMTMLLVLMPIAAIVVASGGWVGKALTHSGVLPEMAPNEAFFISAEFLSQPGVFGLVMAALTAALMSTVDTLITAIAAIVVNDVYKPRKPKASEKDLLKVARITSISIAVFGVLLVPIFMQFDSIYAAHGAFTAAVTPPLVITLLLGVFWRGFTPFAALATMILGSIVIFASIIHPEMIEPFAHGITPGPDSDEMLAGKSQYKYIRGFFGMFWCLIIGVVASGMRYGGSLSEPRKIEEIKGLVWGTISAAIKNYKGSEGEEKESDWADAMPQSGASDAIYGEGLLPMVQLSPVLAEKLQAKANDLVYVSDSRAWLGGLRSSHAYVEAINTDLTGESIQLSDALHEKLVKGRDGKALRVKRLY